MRSPGCGALTTITSTETRVSWTYPRPHRTFSAEVRPYRVAQVGRVSLDYPGDPARLGPNHDVAASSGVQPGLVRPAVRHPKDVPGNGALSRPVGQVQAGFPLDPVQLIIGRSLGHGEHELSERVGRAQRCSGVDLQ